MAKSGYKITLDSVVRSFMIERGEETNHNYMRYLMMAIQGMDDLDFDVSGMPTYKEMNVGDNSTLVIPDDSLKVIGVSFNAGGRMYSFARSNSMNMSFSSECGTDTYTEPPKDDNVRIDSANGYGDLPVEAYTNHYRNGEVLGAFYNATEANVYLFRENDSNGTIELSSNAPSKVVLEYLPTAKRVNSNFMVSPYLREPIMAWLRWAVVRSKERSKNLADSYQRSYVVAKRNLDSRLTSMTAADFIEAVNYGRTASPRF